MVAQLRILTIHQLAVVIPHRWLAANCGSLREWDFGVADMPWTVDILDEAFEKVINEPELFLTDDYIMNIWKPIADKVPPLKNFLTHMFQEKTSNPSGCWEEADKVIPYDEIPAPYFPQRASIFPRHMICV